MIYTMHDDIVIQMCKKFCINIQWAVNALNDLEQYNYNIINRYFPEIRTLLIKGTAHKSIVAKVHELINTK